MGNSGIPPSAPYMPPSASASSSSPGIPASVPVGCQRVGIYYNPDGETKMFNVPNSQTDMICSNIQKYFPDVKPQNCISAIPGRNVSISENLSSYQIPFVEFMCASDYKTNLSFQKQ